MKRLEKMFNHKSSVSQSQAARKFACSKQFVSKTLKNKTSIRFRKKKVIPNRTEVQKINARTRCGRLYAKFQKNLCIMDDESYFTLSHSTINGNRSYLTYHLKAFLKSFIKIYDMIDFYITIVN